MSQLPIRVLFIAGSGRSGTTLLSRILGQLNEVVSVGEIRHLWRLDPLNELCGCGRIFDECPFWNAVFIEAFGSMKQADFKQLYALQQSVDRIRYIPAMLLAGRDSAYAVRLERYRSILLNLYQAITHVSGAPLILDSSKDVSMLYLLVGMPQVELIILHQVRDSRAVAYSWSRKKRRRSRVGKQDYMPRLSSFSSSRAWVYRNLLTWAVRRQASGYLCLRYEDLVQQPVFWTQQVLNLAGVDGADLSFIHEDYLTFAKQNHTASGNPMRFDQGPMEIRLDNAWKQEMSLSHKVLVTSLTWPLLWQYSYLGEES